MAEVNGIITKVNNPGRGGKVKKDPPVVPPRAYPFSTDGSWTVNEKVTFDLSNGNASQVKRRP